MGEHTGENNMKLVYFSEVVFAVALLAAATAIPSQTMAAVPPSAADGALFERLDSNHDGQVAADEVPADHQRLFARLLRKADVNRDATLSREEFVAGLVPTRPEKPLEEKQPSSLPEADAVRWLLLSMDTNGNSSIDAKEVPERLKPVFETMVQRIDGDKNGILERRELNQGAGQLSRIAGRYAREEGIDATAELKKLEKKIGAAAAKRFDEPPPRFDRLDDPEQARRLFAQLDMNSDGQIEKKEVTGPLERPFERLLRAADRDDDGKLSEREFLDGARQIGRRQGRGNARPRPASVSKPAEAMPAEKAMPADESTPAEEK
jgi:Ca2+-binding EF-hand superfamily protein